MSTVRSHLKYRSPGDTVNISKEEAQELDALIKRLQDKAKRGATTPDELAYGFLDAMRHDSARILDIISCLENRQKTAG